MQNTALMIALVAMTSWGATIQRTERELQENVFQRLWNEDFVWKFDDLPVKGSVPEDRIPYSGYIYLDKEGGTSGVLVKYDQAVNRDYSLPATAWEEADTAAARTRVTRRGFFGRSYSSNENDWYGHCNGWSAAAIRHAEPQQSVKAFGTVFTPAEIKGLLAEVYMYNQIEMLAGYETQLNPGTFHAILANWIGRGSHAVAMDSDPTDEKWNYPIYAYSSSSGRHSDREIEVRTNIAYTKDTEDREYDKSPARRKLMAFHYMLNLNEQGEIIGGYYFADSAKIDFVWVPLQPVPSGAEGNESGNPHIDVDTILTIWRKSVPTITRRKWLTIDPPRKDRTVEVEDPTRLLPRNIRIVPPRHAARDATGTEVR